MYSASNQQQDKGPHAPNVNPAPKGAKYVLYIEDVVTDGGKSGLAIWGEIVREAGHETPARRVAMLLQRVIANNTDTIGDVMVDVLSREGGVSHD